MLVQTTVSDLSKITAKADHDLFAPITLDVGSLRIHLPLLQAIELRKVLSAAITDADEMLLGEALFGTVEPTSEQVRTAMNQHTAKFINELFGGGESE